MYWFNRGVFFLFVYTIFTRKITQLYKKIGNFKFSNWTCCLFSWYFEKVIFEFPNNFHNKEKSRKN